MLQSSLAETEYCVPPPPTENDEEMVERPEKIRLLHITTVPQSLFFFRGQVGYMKSKGFEVLALSSPGPFLSAFAEVEQVPVYAVEMPRRISPGRDLRSIVQICRVLRAVHPHIVHAHTPKGGILGMIAAWLSQVPLRIYHIHGLPFDTARGYKRVLLYMSERIACRLAHQVLCVSPSVREVAIAKGLCRSDKVKVFFNGSINGVDATGTFDPAHFGADVRRDIRRTHGIPDQARVLGFVGRIVTDKGMSELSDSWRVLRHRHDDLHLLIVGPFEAGDPLNPKDEAMLRSDPRVHLLGYQREVARYFAIMDLFVMPSYREGFPVANIEAAAMQLPIVSTQIPGCVDSVDDGMTGTLVPSRDSESLTEAIESYLNDPNLARQHGERGRERVLCDFRPRVIWEALYQEYTALLETKTRLQIGGQAFVSMQIQSNKSNHTYRCWGKRILDISLAATFVLLLWPIIGAIALLTRLKAGSPVIFGQVRPGLNSRPFVVYKFRTMTDARDARGALLSDADRLVPFGQFLRRTSLDELPEFLNVLKGDMSLVGPRPLLMEYLGRYTPEQRRRHNVKPGITGWAQVNGRNTITWEQKFKFDVWYFDHLSFWLDVKIIFITIWKILSREGISQPGHATMEPFVGSIPVARQVDVMSGGKCG